MEQKIGEAAGTVWKVLSEKKALTSKQLSKAAGLSAELTNQAIGWLAREGKIAEDVSGGKILLKLKA